MGKTFSGTLCFLQLQNPTLQMVSRLFKTLCMAFCKLGTFPSSYHQMVSSVQAVPYLLPRIWKPVYWFQKLSNKSIRTHSRIQFWQMEWRFAVLFSDVEHRHVRQIFIGFWALRNTNPFRYKISIRFYGMALDYHTRIHTWIHIL